MEEISGIKKYAEKNAVPIMQDGGIEFICNYIKSHNVKQILEIGSAIGYSAIKFASCAPDVKVTTLEIDLERYIKAVQNINDNGLSDRIRIFNEDALHFEFGKTEGTQKDEKFDLIFIDAAKAQYIKFFEKFKENLSDGGVIISDNLSFHGMVDDLSLTHNYSTIKLVRKIKKYVDFLKGNTEFTTQFFEIGDRISVSRKNSSLNKEEIFALKRPSSKLNVKLIAFDLDDTLLNKNLEISKRTVEVIKKAVERGIYIVICSGRGEGAILPYVRALDIAGTEQGRYLISYNGANCIDLHTRKSLYTQNLGSGILKLVHAEAAKRNLGCHVSDENTVYADRDTEWTRLNANICGLKFEMPEDFDRFLEKGFPKILIPAPEEKVAEFFPYLKALLKGRAEVCTSKPFFLEVMPHNCGKGETILWLADHLRIRKIETMAFGDGLNDESMMKLVEYGVAMKNGVEYIKETARFVTEKTNDEDGAADFIEKYVL